MYFKVWSNEVLRKEAFKEVSYELDNLLEASPLSASILDIIATSSSTTFPKIVGYEVDVHARCGWAMGGHWQFGPCSASVINCATTWGASKEEVGFNGTDQGSLLAEDATSRNRQT